MHQIWHTYSTKDSLSNDTKNIPVKHCFQGQTQGHSLNLCLTLKRMSEFGDLGVIRQRIFGTISVPSLT